MNKSLFTLILAIGILGGSASQAFDMQDLDPTLQIILKQIESKAASLEKKIEKANNNQAREMLLINIQYLEDEIHAKIAKCKEQIASYEKKINETEEDDWIQEEYWLRKIKAKKKSILQQEEVLSYLLFIKVKVQR